MNIIKSKNIKWVHIIEPTEKDIAWLTKEFAVHPIIAKELERPSSLTRVEIFKNHLFLICYFPVYDKEDGVSLRTEVDFIITKDAVITLQYESSKEIFNDFKFGTYATSLELMYRIMEHIITFEERQILHVREKVEAVSKELFKNKEEDVFKKLTYLKRDASEYRIIARLQEPVLKSLLSKGSKFWGGDAEIYLGDLVGKHLNVISQLEDCREAIADFEETNNQLLNTKVNRTMKTLTALSFLTFPFMLIAALLDMRTNGTPFVDLPGAFWIISGSIVTGITILGIYFKKKNWF